MKKNVRVAHLDIEGMMSVSFTPRGECEDLVMTADNRGLFERALRGCSRPAHSTFEVRSKSEKGMLKFISQSDLTTIR